MCPGPDLIRACPACGRLVKQQTPDSGNSFGGCYWTDSKSDLPMLPEFPAITKCCRCAAFFWIDDAELKGEMAFDFDHLSMVEYEGEQAKLMLSHPDWADADVREFLDVAGLRAASDQGLGTDRAKERYLRPTFGGASTTTYGRTSMPPGCPLRTRNF